MVSESYYRSYSHIARQMRSCSPLAWLARMVPWLRMQKARRWPLLAVQNPASVLTLVTVPVLARTLLSAAVPRSRLRSVPSRPAMGSVGSRAS